MVVRERGKGGLEGNEGLIKGMAVVVLVCMHGQGKGRRRGGTQKHFGKPPLSVDREIETGRA